MIFINYKEMTTLTVSNIELLYKTLQKKYNHNFATCNVAINEGSPLWGILHLVFNLDRSGSMGTPGDDKKTPWEYVTHMMHNVFQY